MLVLRAFQIADGGIAAHILPGLERGAFHRFNLAAGVPGVEVVEDVLFGNGKAKNRKASIHAGLRRLALNDIRRKKREKDIKRQIERHRFGRMQLTTVFSLFSSPVPKQIQF
jgi:hypothetical protein